MKAEQDYDLPFFSEINATSRKSAEIIVPLIIDLLSPGSVIDIGCGTGTWLSVFKAHNINDITGVDGHWVEDAMLLVPKSCFVAHDLTQSLNIERRFDVAVSLEVAEHLDRKYARNFVSTLVKLSSVIVFSAAIPFQDGTHHVNEEWPDYWAKLFGEHEYVPIDCIREKIWNNEDVAWWYAQNILVFAQREHVLENPKLQKAFELTRLSQLSLVHPGKYLQAAHRCSSLKQALQMLPRLMIKAIGAKLRLARSLAANVFILLG
jgi:SAM-dependent methyltransferase